MKRTNSASSILRPKNSLSQNDLQRLARDPPTTTVLTVNKLPSYNADRLYIQSELQVHSSLHILHEFRDITRSIILYVLWDAELTPRMFADTLSERVRECLLQAGEHVDREELENSKCNPVSNFSPRRQLSDASVDEVYLQSPSVSCDEMEKYQQSVRIYVVVDKVASSKCDLNGIGELPNFSDSPASRRDEDDESNSPIEHEQQKQTEQHNSEIKSAESLARAVASSRFLRGRIDGISVGITSESRAAPGLEACMDAVARSSKERRFASNVGRELASMDTDDSLKCLRNRSPERSPISIVICKPDDLEDVNGHSHHHHHQGNQLLQSRVTVEWNGKGDYNTFSDRAMHDWRRVWSTSQTGKTGFLKRRVRRISKSNEDEEEDTFDEPVSTFMVIVFVAGAVLYLWNTYSDHLYDISFCYTTKQP